MDFQTAAAGGPANATATDEVIPARSGRSSGGAARTKRPERCANAAVHTFGHAPVTLHT
jgi:hypothetical protein